MFAFFFPSILITLGFLIVASVQVLLGAVAPQIMLS
jgi:hypothetical protein